MKTKEARFPEGESVDVPEYLREHGNPEAAEEWEKMNEEYGDMLKKVAGGTDPEWMEALEKDMKTLASRSGGLVQLLEVRAFDEYQGPYANIQVKNLGGFKVWTLDEGFYIPDFPIVNTSSSERDGYKARGLADLIEGIKKAVKESRGKKATELYSNPTLIHAIRAGDRVTILDRFGQEHTGTAVMVSGDRKGWVLNMGGPHGTPGIATEDNVTKVKKGKKPMPSFGPSRVVASESTMKKNALQELEKMAYDFDDGNPTSDSQAMTSIMQSSFEKVHGFYWGLYWMEPDEEGPDEGQYRDIEKAYKILKGILQDPMLRGLVKHYLKTYDHLDGAYTRPNLPPTGIVIRQKATVDANPLKAAGWVNEGTTMGRVVWKHPDSDTTIMTSLAERSVVFSPASARIIKQPAETLDFSRFASEDESTSDLDAMLADYEEEGTDTKGDDRHPELDEGSLIPGIQERLASDTKLRDFAKVAGVGRDLDQMPDAFWDQTVKDVAKANALSVPQANWDLGTVKLFLNMAVGAWKKHNKKADHMAALEALAGNPADDKFSRFEEGKPADPTQNMSPEDKAKWNKEKEEHKDEFKKEAKEPERTLGKKGPLGYIALYKGRQVEVYADSPIKAREIAATYFKAKKEWEVDVWLAEKNGKPVVHTPTFASTKSASHVVFAEDEHGETFAFELPPMEALIHMASVEKTAFSQTDEDFVEWAINQPPMNKAQTIAALKRAGVGDILPPKEKPQGPRFQVGDEVLISASKHKNPVTADIYNEHDKKLGTVVATDSNGATVQFKSGTPVHFPDAQSRKGVGIYKWIKPFDMQGSKKLEIIYEAGKPAKADRIVVVEQYLSRGKSEPRKVPYFTGHVFTARFNKSGGIYFTVLPQQRLHVDPRGQSTEAGFDATSINPDVGTLYYLGIFGKRPQGWETELESMRQNARVASSEIPGEDDKLSRFEEGKPADPTKNMSPEDAKKWEGQKEEHKDEFKKEGYTSYKGDPFWMKAKYPGKADDGTPFKKGADILYWPRTKTIMVGRKAEQEWREFQAHAEDEDTYMNQYHGASDAPDDKTANILPPLRLTPIQRAANFLRDLFNEYEGELAAPELERYIRTMAQIYGKANLAKALKMLITEGYVVQEGTNWTWPEMSPMLLSRTAAALSPTDKAKLVLEDLFERNHGKVSKDDIAAFMDKNKYMRTALIVALKKLVHENYIDLEGNLYRWGGGSLSDALEANWGTHLAAQSPTGLYGYTRKVQADCETASRKLAKHATAVAKRIYAKDEKVAEFLATHAKRGKSIPAQILVASLQNMGPKFASEDTKESAEEGKTASNRTYGLYGFGSKTANLGITACAEIREQAGLIASDLHHRRADAHEHITGFLARHAKEGKCAYSRLLHASYPDASLRLASSQSVTEWLSWEE